MDKDFVCSWFVLTVFLLIMGAISWLYNSAQCKVKAEVLGYQCSFGPLQGCVLIKPDGTKMLLEQIREFNSLR